MELPSRAVVVATAVAAGATLLVTWLAVRGSAPSDGDIGVDGDAWPWTALRWGSALSDALGLGAALAAHVRLRGRWGRPSAVAVAVWLALVFAAAAAGEVGAPEAFLRAVGLALLYGSLAGLVVVPLGGITVALYISFVLTPPRPTSPLERAVLAAGLLWTFAVVPVVFVIIDLDLAAFEGFT